MIEEFKITSNNENINNKIYKIVQSTYDIFEKPFFSNPENRLKVKKDTINNRIKTNRLLESISGFEHYEIYYDKNKILNFSIKLQSYGSPWESNKYYTFDLNKGSKIGSDFFINQQKLLKICQMKFKNENKNLIFKLEDLNNYKILMTNNQNISGLDFSLFDYKNHRNSGYEEFIVHFDWKEIKNYVSKIYLKRL